MEIENTTCHFSPSLAALILKSFGIDIEFSFCISGFTLKYRAGNSFNHFSLQNTSPVPGGPVVRVFNLVCFPKHLKEMCFHDTKIDTCSVGL